jgi:hypothetical protein
MIFHLGDSYFFMNELIKTQPTSQEESDLYNAIIKVRKFSMLKHLLRKTNVVMLFMVDLALQRLFSLTFLCAEFIKAMCGKVFYSI